MGIPDTCLYSQSHLWLWKCKRVPTVGLSAPLAWEGMNELIAEATIFVKTITARLGWNKQQAPKSQWLSTVESYFPFTENPLKIVKGLFHPIAGMQALLSMMIPPRQHSLWGRGKGNLSFAQEVFKARLRELLIPFAHSPLTRTKSCDLNLKLRKSGQVSFHFTQEEEEQLVGKHKAFSPLQALNQVFFI